MPLNHATRYRRRKKGSLGPRFVVETEVPEGYYGAVAMRGSGWRVVARWLPADYLAVGK